MNKEEKYSMLRIVIFGAQKQKGRKAVEIKDRRQKGRKAEAPPPPLRCPPPHSSAKAYR